MVDDSVEHEPEMPSEPPHIAPAPVLWCNRLVVDHRESIVRRPGKEWKDMDPADQAIQMLLAEFSQRRKRRPFTLLHLIRVADQNRVSFAQPCLTRLRNLPFI